MIAKTDLSGNWSLHLDESRKEVREKICYDDCISLPSTTSFSKKGKPNPARETGFLTDEYKFEGNAWFSRKFSFDAAAFVGKTAILFLERTRITSVYINGNFAGTQDSFVAPLEYDLTGFLKDGENLLDICVSNVGYKTAGGHMTSADTQSNWNGIIGEISLRIMGESYAKNLFIESDTEKSCLYVKADICGKSRGKASVCAVGIRGNEQVFPEMEFPFENGKLSAVYPMPGAALWSEFSPALFKVTVKTGDDSVSAAAGLRKFSAKDGKFTINGRKTFLRGKHDGMVFPKTGYAPTDVESWLEVMGISRAYGINHYRFHTCCPPDAAFEAADILGIYMEPQIPFWGTVTVEGEEKHDQAEQDFLIEEGFRMLREFGNHPSFCMMSLGNELWGSTEKINEMLGNYKKADSRHLYTQGSNNFQWFPNVVENDDFFVGVRLSKDRLIRGSYAMCDAPLGHVQTEKPSTMYDYDSVVRPEVFGETEESSKDKEVKIQFGTTMKTVKANEAGGQFIPEVPIVTHEIGQYETFPDFGEIEKYTGPLKARNLEVFRERLESRGMGELGDKFFKASGKLAAECYKEELESVFRSKSLAGFQLLDLQDFPGQGTALVGILNSFMENKGAISREDWLDFCGDKVILARFPSYTWQAGEEFQADIELVNYSPEDLAGKTAVCRLEFDGCQAEGRFIIPAREEDENYFSLGKFSASVPRELEAPCKGSFEIYVEGAQVKNSYSLWFYPELKSVDLAGTYIFPELCEEARSLLEEGKTVLIIPELSSLENSVEGFYCTDFWCYPMFRSISEKMGRPEPTGTMGLLINTCHPALADFPCEYYSTPQWWEIVRNSRSEILDGNCEDKNIIVRTIDNFDRSHVLGLLYEYPSGKGKVVVLNADISALSTSPEGRQFIKSVVGYCRS